MKPCALVATAVFCAACCAFAQAQSTAQKPAVLHGRVKDQQCGVLAGLHVRVRFVGTPGFATERTVTTDEGGNYTVELAPGAYDVCVERTAGISVCNHIDMPASGDKWMTTQLRDAAPDLSNLGNHTE